MTRITCGFVVVLMHIVFFAPATASAERKDSYADKIEREKKTLEKLRGTIVEKRKKADEAEKKRESVLQGLQSLDERLVRSRVDNVRTPQPENMSSASIVSASTGTRSGSAMPVNRHCPAFDVRTRHWRFLPSSASA